MKLVFQIAAGIILGSLVFWGGCALLLGSVAVESQRERVDAVDRFFKASAVQAQQDADRWRQQQQRILPLDQVCVVEAKASAGVVWLRPMNGRVAWSQLLEHGQAVPCWGNHRVY